MHRFESLELIYYNLSVNILFLLRASYTLDQGNTFASLKIQPVLIHVKLELFSFYFE